MKRNLFYYAIMALNLTYTFANAKECKTPDYDPKPITPFNVDKAYPKLAEKYNVEGNIKLIVEIDKNGNVTKAQIVEYSSVLFNSKSIIKAAKEIKFIPAKKNCVYVKSDYMFNVNFILQ